MTATSPAVRRLLALASGALCHGLFAAAVTTMALGLHSGMATGLGRVPQPFALPANLLLLLQFPLLHSLLLGRWRHALGVLQPRIARGRLATTLFATIASLQLLATFVLWTPTGGAQWQPSGAWAVVANAMFAGSWLLLGKAILDAGIGLQTGSIGWLAVYRDRPVAYPPMPVTGLFQRCRQPIYLGFALTLWTGPHWNFDHLCIAIGWTVYCAVGPLAKERRFATTFGEAFRDYRRSVPYLLPRITR